MALGLPASPAGRAAFCEFKGEAVYHATSDGSELGWSYPDPSPGYEQLRDHLAFYTARVDAITLDGQLVASQAGGLYGGWITSNVVGSLKGEPGTSNWRGTAACGAHRARRG